jgi:hypothetical protein
MEENKHCYTFEEILFDDEFLPAVDVTYIIHLEGNGREPHIQEQLKEYHPTKRLFILHNQGFKKCEKKNVAIPPIDLVDAFLQIFKHARERQYDNILILEDDFIFSEKMKDPYHQNNVNEFIKTKQGENFMYFLGCLPHLVVPNTYTTYTVFSSSATHSVIYSKQNRDEMLKLEQSTIMDWDDHSSSYPLYMYYVPLCYQLFPETDNYNHWGGGHILAPYVMPFAKYTLKILQLDKQVEPGYSILYGFSKALFWILLFILLYLVYQLVLLLRSIMSSSTNRATLKQRDGSKKRL